MTSRDIPLFTPDGAIASLADLAGPTLVVQLVRYFGCLPCQVYLRALDGRADELSAVGARPLAIGGSAAHQARWLRDTGVSMPLLLDPQQRFRAWVGLGDLSARQMLSPAGLRRYAAAVLSGVPIRRPTEDVMRAPGIAILDADLVLHWSYEGSSLGDYPPLDAVLRHARALGNRNARTAGAEHEATRPPGRVASSSRGREEEPRLGERMPCHGPSWL